MLLTLHIQLANIQNPIVFRQITVPAEFSFHKLHLILQAAFGWENDHLYQFSQDGFGSDVTIGIPHEDDWNEVKDSKKIKLSEVLNKRGQKYTYIYDFGDSWTHDITVEKLDDAKASKPDCIAGEGACPPEDCGGPWGYEELKKTLANPRHKEYKSMREWLGLEKKEKWDPAAFNLEETKLAIS